MLNVGVLGYGYWGPNLVRNFVAVGAHVKYVVDLDSRRLAGVKAAYPSIAVTSDMDDVFGDASVDAVVIALPVFLHYETAKKAILAGKHVLVEKPMTDSAVSSLDLIELAEAKGKVLMCDHTFLYTGAVRKIKEITDAGDMGKLEYFDSVRINLGLFQSDINVIWDLAPHDVSILSYLVKEIPVSISATGVSHTNSAKEDIAYLTLFYQSNFIAHISVSWVSPVKIRQIIIGGDKKMVVYNDLEPSEKIKIYDSGYSISSIEEQNRFKVDYRMGDIFIPKLDTTEALRGLAQDFLDAVEKSQKPLSDAALALNVVKILQASEESIRYSGKEIKLL